MKRDILSVYSAYNMTFISQHGRISSSHALMHIRFISIADSRHIANTFDRMKKINNKYFSSYSRT